MESCKEKVIIGMSVGTTLVKIRNILFNKNNKNKKEVTIFLMSKGSSSQIYQNPCATILFTAILNIEIVILQNQLHQQQQHQQHRLTKVSDKKY